MATATKKASKATKNGSKATSKPQSKQVASEVKKASNNPFREGSCYWAICEVLLAAKGKPMDFASLKKGVAASMGKDRWAIFTKREGRNENAKDTDARIHQNVGVLQRADYGKPLHDLGLAIQKVKDEERGWLYAIGRKAK